MGMVGIALLLLAVGLVVWLVARQPSSGSHAAAVGRRIVDDVPATPAAIALLERWRNRAARWRTLPGIPVVLATLVLSIAVRHEVRVGVGEHPGWSDPLLMGLLAVFAGAIGAELHLVRRARSRGPVLAELVPRDVHRHLPPASRTRLAAIGCLAVTASALTVTVVGQVPVTGLLALGVVGLVPAVQHRIVVRRRPVLPDDLRAADEAVRRLAARSVDEAGVGAAILLIAWQFAPVYLALDLAVAAEVMAIGGQIAAVVLAIVLWRRSSPRRLLPDVAEAVRDHTGAGAT